MLAEQLRWALTITGPLFRASITLVTRGRASVFGMRKNAWSPKRRPRVTARSFSSLSHQRGDGID